MKILLKITAIAGLTLMGHQLMAQTTANHQESEQKAVAQAGTTAMSTGQLKVYNSLVAELENFNFDYTYDIVSYDAVLIKKDSQEGKFAKGFGPLFAKNTNVQGLIREAKPGDRLIFENIKVKGPGQAARFAKNSVTINVR